MYHWIRRIHLFAGLFLLVFVLLYFVSGWMMIHGQWFHHDGPKKTTRTEHLAYQGDRSAPEFARYLEETFGLRGKRQPPRQHSDGTWQFNYVRPGQNFEVRVSPAGDQATITTTDFDAMGLANGLHRARGYGGGWLYDLWSAIYDLASAAMILFALSGIYLWHQFATIRWPGWLCLGLSFGFTAAMILYLLYSR